MKEIQVPKNQYKMIYHWQKKYHNQKKIAIQFSVFGGTVYTARCLKCMGFNCFKFLQINENLEEIKIYYLKYSK